jgi:alpha-glucosidase
LYWRWEILSASAFAQSMPSQVTSPDGQLVLRFAVNGNGQLIYNVTFQGKRVMQDSAMNLRLDGNATALGSLVHIVAATTSSGIEEYSLPTQKTSHVHDAWNGLILQLAESTGTQRAMTVEARAFNGGLAFRYLLPGDGSFRLKEEQTEFNPVVDTENWALLVPDFRSAYESEYLKLTTTALEANNLLVAMPLLIHEHGVAWIGVMEADIEGNSSMYLKCPPGRKGHLFMTVLSPPMGGGDTATEGTLPHKSAWRVMLVGEEPGKLLESNVVYDLNPAARGNYVDWVRVGKSSWDWWSGTVDAGGKTSYTTENMKRFIDFSSASGFPYFMLDEGWSTRKDILHGNGKVDIPELVRYAAAKSVRVWIWASAAAVKSQMQDAFALFESWGVAGVKIDFLQRDDQEGVQFYYDVAREAAKHKLMIDFHGTRTPWGLERTYPNVLSYEGILGMEQNKAGRRETPANRVALAFTRMMAGPADYTAGGFTNVTADKFVQHIIEPMVMGTRAQQLALYVIFQTPLPMVSDSPQMYAGHPEFQFLKDVPATWDEMRVVGGSPDTFATIARRCGDEWDVGSITGDEAREITVPLSFLSPGAYTAEIYEDALDADREPTHVVIRKQVVRRNETMKFHLAVGGGVAVRFTRK